jgi:uncharacterized protein
VDLKAKLARLPPPHTTGTASAVGLLPSGVEATLAGVLGAPVDGGQAWREALGETRALQDFAEGGSVGRRRRWPGFGARVGRIPISAAKDVSAPILSLLALDPRLARLDLRRALYLDTETTGLGGGAGTLAFVVGLAGFEDERPWFEQLFLRSPAEEEALLDALSERLSTAELLVTFNGKSFDWPLLTSRFVMNRRPVPPSLPHLDLLHVARRIHRRRLGSVSLQRLEGEVLGMVRGEDVDSREIPARYAHYLRTQNPLGLDPVMVHNEVDVLSMMALVGLYGEPLPLLDQRDLVSLGRTYFRAGDLARAGCTAERALEITGDPEARWLLAELSRARRDRDAALQHFECLAEELDDPRVRLELVKLYEHHAKAPLRALAVLAQGTGEDEVATARRRERLSRKMERAEARTHPEPCQLPWPSKRPRPR